MSTILIVGAADTGRAPMAAALLRREVERRGLQWHVSSAGVLGHDDDPPEQEARTAMLSFGLNISEHLARSTTDELIDQSQLVVAVDSGTAKALRARFPTATAKVHSLGELAGRARDIPDPFRMQVGAWITYARELETLIGASLGRMRELIGEPVHAIAGPVVTKQVSEETHEQPAQTHNRSAALQRVARLLGVAVDMPEVLDWAAARARLEAEVGAATQPYDPADLAAAYGGLLRAALALSAAPPTAGQMRAFQAAWARLEHAIGQEDLAWLSGQMGGWNHL